MRDLTDDQPIADDAANEPLRPHSWDELEPAPDELPEAVALPAGVWGAASLLAVIVGCLGPWANVAAWDQGASRGWLIALISCGAGLAAIARPASSRAVELSVAMVLAVVAAYDLGRVMAFDAGGLVQVSVGWGLVFVLLGTASFVAWCVTQIASEPRRGAFACLIVALTLGFGALGSETAGSVTTGGASHAGAPR